MYKQRVEMQNIINNDRYGVYHKLPTTWSNVARYTPCNFHCCCSSNYRKQNAEYFAKMCNIIINCRYITSSVHFSPNQFTIRFNSAALQTRKMFSACTLCYSNFSTPAALQRHERRFHPTTKNKQILCKPCNMPF